MEIAKLGQIFSFTIDPKGKKIAELISSVENTIHHHEANLQISIIDFHKK